MSQADNSLPKLLPHLTHKSEANWGLEGPPKLGVPSLLYEMQWLFYLGSVTQAFALQDL